MNNKGAVSLVWIVIAISAFILTITLSFNTYSNMMLSNNGYINTNDSARYGNIINQTDSYKGYINTVKESSILEKITLGTGVFFNSLLYGASSILTLGTAAKQSQSILEIIMNSNLPIPILLLVGFIISAITIYVTVRIWQEIRGSIIGT